MIGAREHYAVPRMLQASGRLHTFFADAWAGPLLRLIKHGPSAARAAAARCHPDLPSAKVVSFTADTLRRRLTSMFARTASGVSARYFNYLSVGSDFARQVNQRLERLPRSTGRGGSLDTTPDVWRRWNYSTAGASRPWSIRLMRAAFMRRL